MRKTLDMLIESLRVIELVYGDSSQKAITFCGYRTIADSHHMCSVYFSTGERAVNVGYVVIGGCYVGVVYGLVERLEVDLRDPTSIDAVERVLNSQYEKWAEVQRG